MNSKFLKNGVIVALSFNVVNGVQMSQKSETNLQAQHKLVTQQGGIFGRMIEQAEAPEALAEEKKAAKARKEQQLAEAEADYQKQVKVEEDEEAAKKKKDEQEAEDAALEAAKKTPQAQMLAAANAAATNINVGELESNIQAQLQARLDSGASKADILSSLSGDDAMAQTSAANTAAIAAAAETTTETSTNAKTIIAQVLASHKVPVAAKKPIVLMKKKKAAPVAVDAPVAPVQSIAQTATSVEAKASMDKVKEMAGKLGVPFTSDLMALGSNSAISDRLIENAVAAGKTETQINAAMASL